MLPAEARLIVATRYNQKPPARTKYMKTDLTQDYPESDPLRELRIVFAGSRKLGIFADAIEAIADWRIPTPLPKAPRAVLGVVCIHGRMLTVLDVVALLNEEVGVASSKPSNPSSIVALRGDEQLALAVDGVGETIAIATDELQAAESDEGRPVLGVVHRGDAPVTVLNLGELFAAAIRGRERRRRRF